MIEYVDRLLVHWAQEMSVHVTEHGLGMRSTWAVNIYEGGTTTRPLTAHGVASRTVKGRGGIGRVAERVNQAVERLPPHLAHVVRVHYLENPSQTHAQKALLLECSVRTMHRHIHKAHGLLSADLPDSYVNFMRVIHRG